MLDNYSDSIKLLLEMSLYRQYHPCIDYFLAKLLTLIENEFHYFFDLQRKALKSKN